MAASSMNGEGTSEEGVGASGDLVLVPVVQTGKWKGAVEASSVADNSKTQRNRRGLDRKGEPLGCVDGGAKLVEGSPREKLAGRGNASVGIEGTGKQKEKGDSSGAKSVGPDPVGLNQGCSTPGKCSPSKAKFKGPKALTLSPGCCWGPSMAIGGQGGGADEGVGILLDGGVVDGGKEGGLRGNPGKRGKVRGSPRAAREGEKVPDGKGEREGRRKGGAVKGQIGSSGGSHEVDSPARRERMRSPVVGRVVGGVGKASSSGSRGKQIRQPLFSHGTLVTRIQQAVSQNANDDVTEVVEEGGRGQASPGNPCDQ